jgi:hypothetical protein
MLRAREILEENAELRHTANPTIHKRKAPLHGRHRNWGSHGVHRAISVLEAICKTLTINMFVGWPLNVIRTCFLFGSNFSILNKLISGGASEPEAPARQSNAWEFHFDPC